MRKSIKLLVACMLCSPVAIVAQEQDSLFARKSKVAIEYGRGISFNPKIRKQSQWQSQLQ